MGARLRFKGLAYERCAELPLVIDWLRPLFDKRIRYLDIGSGGESALPSFFLRHTSWDIVCVDKCAWVQRQYELARRVMNERRFRHRFRVINQDLLTTKLPADSFDVITSISVIEHFEGETDSKAMAASARLLRPGGHYVFTTPVNEGHFREYYVQRPVYGESCAAGPVYYQRHYDSARLQSRLIDPTGLDEEYRVFFGDFGFQCFEKVFSATPWPIRTLYRWAQPWFARKFLSYSETPVSRETMGMNTASGVIVVLRKPWESAAQPAPEGRDGRPIDYMCLPDSDA
ncbi:MAG: class I SAM-dependent methyltransferase [Thermoguttaceae bacterium]|jgi:SAM-dependent methyltransferase|nr:class I SAM-dependent methyltransferase [Thermoguttaceae bacterium]